MQGICYIYDTNKPAQNWNYPVYIRHFLPCMKTLYWPKKSLYDFTKRWVRHANEEQRKPSQKSLCLISSLVKSEIFNQRSSAGYSHFTFC